MIVLMHQGLPVAVCTSVDTAVELLEERYPAYWAQANGAVLFLEHKERETMDLCFGYLQVPAVDCM